MKPVITISEALSQATETLTKSNVSSAQLDALILLELVTRHDRTWLLAHGGETLGSRLVTSYLRLIDQRAQRIPLVHLTGTKEFYGLELAISPAVLTPRVETEKMVEFAVKYAPKGSKLIDIGTGSGAVAIATATHRPDLAVWATDISAAALKIARANAHKHRVEIKFTRSDLWDSALLKNQTFDTVVANLPYLTDDAELMPEVQHEAAIALFGGSDGLELYRRFFKKLPQHLSPGGYLFTESDPWQQADLIRAAAKIDLTPIEQDYFILGFQLKN